MSKSASRYRRDKLVEDDKPVAKEKFQPEVAMTQQAIPRLEAKTQNQRTALAMFREGKSVIFLSGSAGTGKSMLGAYHLSTLLKQKKIEKIYLIRPAVAVGKSIGLIPGDESMKMLPYFRQTLAHFEKFLGKGYLNYCLEKEIVQMFPAEYLRGMSMDGVGCLTEESQNFTKEEFEMCLTRLGENSYAVYTGDFKQHDLRGQSGLEQTLALIRNMQETEPDYLLDEDLEQLNKNIGVVQFEPEDVVRSGLTRAFVKIYYNN